MNHSSANGIQRIDVTENQIVLPWIISAFAEVQWSVVRRRASVESSSLENWPVADVWIVVGRRLSVSSSIDAADREVRVRDVSSLDVHNEEQSMLRWRNIRRAFLEENSMRETVYRASRNAVNFSWRVSKCWRWRSRWSFNDSRSLTQAWSEMNAESKAVSPMTSRLRWSVRAKGERTDDKDPIQSSKEREASGLCLWLIRAWEDLLLLIESTICLRRWRISSNTVRNDYRNKSSEGRSVLSSTCACWKRSSVDFHLSASNKLSFCSACSWLMKRSSRPLDCSLLLFHSTYNYFSLGSWIFQLLLSLWLRAVHDDRLKGPLLRLICRFVFAERCRLALRICVFFDTVVRLRHSVTMTSLRLTGIPLQHRSSSMFSFLSHSPTLGQVRLSDTTDTVVFDGVRWSLARDPSGVDDHRPVAILPNIVDNVAGSKKRTLWMSRTVSDERDIEDIDYPVQWLPSATRPSEKETNK